MFKKQVVIVAGFDYEDAGLPFLRTAKNRIERLMAKFPKDQLRFTLFDVGAGIISQNEIDNKTKKRGWGTVSTYTPVSSANYSSWVKGQSNKFDRDQTGVMSITDVYSFIQNVGSGKDEGTVVELSFFTHGWQGGGPYWSTALTPRQKTLINREILTTRMPGCSKILFPQQWMLRLWLFSKRDLTTTL